MFSKQMPLFAFALACALLARPCQAMLVTPVTPEEGQVALDQAIARRNAAEINSTDFKRVHERQTAAQTQALTSVKDAVARPITGPDAASEVPEGAASYTYFAIGAMLAIPVTVFLLIVWLTRRALACRERERLAMLRILRPSQAAMAAVKVEEKTNSTPKLDPIRRKKLQEIWAKTLARMQSDPRSKSDGTNLSPTPTPV